MQPEPQQLSWHVAAFAFTRLVVSTAIRMVYPFLPAIARGLGVPFESVTLAISARSAVGLAGPILGSFADVHGRKPVLLAGLGVFSAGLFAVYLLPGYTAFFVGLLISGGAAIVIDSVIHAYIGDHVPYRRRGRAMAIVESGWSLAFILGIPLAGLIIARYGWHTPFALLGAAGILAGGILWRLLPALPHENSIRPALWQGLSRIFHSRKAWSGLLFSLLVVAANQLISVIFGVWLEQRFGLGIEQIGAASSVIGIAGIAGVVLAAILTDGLGKRRAIGLGLLLNLAAMLGLQFTGASLAGVLVVLFFFYLSFEFTLTSSIPLMSELVPQARSTFLAANMAAISSGDALGALVGPLLLRSGLVWNVAAVVLLDLAAVLLLAKYVHPLPGMAEGASLEAGID